MCQLRTRTIRWIPLEQTHKGELHKVKKWVQETAMDGVDQFVG